MKLGTIEKYLLVIIKMSEFTHSSILFSGDDGLPIQFNIQSVVEKEKLKKMIEYGGGICTHSADAVFLVSPGTKVFNYTDGKKFISSRFIIDCVEENYLHDMDDYKIEITEVDASDFSEDSSLKMLEKTGGKLSDSNDNSIDIIDQNKNGALNDLIFPKSNHAFDFGDTEQLANEAPQRTSKVFPLQFYPGPPPDEPQLNSSTTSDDLDISFTETNPSNSAKNKLHVSPTPPVSHNKEYLPNVGLNEKKFLTSTECEDFQALDDELSLSTGEENRNMHVSSTPEDLISYNEGQLQTTSEKETMPATRPTSNRSNIPSNEESSINESKLQIHAVFKQCDNLTVNNDIENETYPFSVISKDNSILNAKQKPHLVVDHNLPDSSEDLERSITDGQNLVAAEDFEMQAVLDVPQDNANIDKNSADSSINVVVTSSQPNVGEGMDQFDEMIMSKLQEKPSEQEEELSQSYTVSSSADAQVSSKPPHDTSAEIFAGSAPAPDSPGLVTERQKYITELEKEIEKILEKPSPKSLQDKIVLVKYICCVKKLAPAIVLQTLQNF